jgi:Zn-finger nucleic acid-binding protein
MAHALPSCPRCSAQLFDGHAREAKLLGCGQCGGVWLDSAASKAVLQGEAKDLVGLADLASRHATVAVDTQVSNLACPECGQPMTRGAVPGTRIEIDLCSRHGTWFDPNELRLVALAYARLPEPAQFADPYPEERRRAPWELKWSDRDPDRDWDDHHFEKVMDFLVGLIDRVEKK